MKIRSLIASIVLALAFAPGAYSQGGPGGGGGAPGAGGPGGGGPGGGAPANAAPKTDLEKQMDLINDAQGTPRGALMAGGVADLADATKKDEALKRIAVIKGAATEAAKLAPKYVPATLTTDADKAKFVDDFRATMKKFITAIEALETAVKAGKVADAPGLWDAANNIHNDAHMVYRAPRGGRGGAGAPGGAGGRGPGGAPGGAPGAGGPGGGAAPAAAPKAP